MNKISDVLNKQIQVMIDRNWDNIYVAIDWHDTMMPATYSNGEYGEYKLYPFAETVLKWMSDSSEIRLILYTCSHPEQKAEFIHNMHQRYGINFDYHNGNPEVPNTETGDFSEKFYYNLLLDDKAGFNPNIDWLDLLDNMHKADKMMGNIL